MLAGETFSRGSFTGNQLEINPFGLVFFGLVSKKIFGAVNQKFSLPFRLVSLTFHHALKVAHLLSLFEMLGGLWSHYCLVL